MNLKVTWLGHSAFLMETPTGKRLLFDPFLTGNPKNPVPAENIGPIDLMLLSHGHGDHIGDAVKVAQASGCRVIGIVELIGYLTGKGISGDKTTGINKGGSFHFEDLGLTVTLTHAFHSSSIQDGDHVVYTGEPTGIIVTLDSGFVFYFAGDTNVFGDMALIAELYSPKLIFLPIGDHFTMGAKEAAKAVELLKAETVVPMHYDTFPLLTGTAEAFRAAVSDRGLPIEVKVLTPGETANL